MFANEQEGRFEYRGCDLHYWLSGPAGAPLVVFSPGAYTDHTLFDPQVEPVTQRYRMLRWDLRGHGRSRSTEPPFSPWQSAEDLAALLDHLGEQRVALVGQSIGGNVSQDFIFRYPTRCLAAVFLDCTCSTFALSALERLPLKLTPTLLRAYPLEAFKRQVMRSSAHTAVAQERLRAMLAPLSGADMRRISLGTFSAIHAEPGYHLPCPSLIAYGAEDRLGNIREIAERWARRDGAVGPIVIGQAGHVANLDNADEFNRVLLNFLDHVLLPSRADPLPAR